MKMVRSWRTRQPQSSVLRSPQTWVRTQKRIDEKWNHGLCVSLLSLHLSFYLVSLPLQRSLLTAHPFQSLPWLNVPLLFAPFLSACLLSSGSTHGHIRAVQYLLCLIVNAIDCLLFAMYKRSAHPYRRHIQTHTHTRADWCLLGGKCVAGMVIRKKIDMHTRWTSVSLHLTASVSAARLIHL